jgi:hypothetical protein
MVCTRCGRSNHKAANCFAKSTKSGKTLSKETSPVWVSQHSSSLSAHPSRPGVSVMSFTKKGVEPGSRPPPDANSTSKRTWYFNGNKYIKVGRKPNAYWSKE